MMVDTDPRTTPNKHAEVPAQGASLPDYTIDHFSSDSEKKLKLLKCILTSESASERRVL